MLCRMTLCSWNLLSLIVLLLYVIMNAYCYSCEEGRQQFSTCNCQDNSTKCVTEVEYRETVQLSCCLNASMGISWYKESTSNDSKIGYDNKSNTKYTINATQIDKYDIDFSKHTFEFSDGGKTFKMSEARLSFAGTYICVSGGQEFVQYVEVHKDYSKYDAKLYSSLDTKCPSEVGAHLSEEKTLCCKFQINARVDNISIKWFFENATEPLKTENNYIINSECNESILEEDSTVSTVVKTFLKLSRVTPASYGNYKAVVNAIPYKKDTEMTSTCVLMLYESINDSEDKEGTFYCVPLIVIALLILVVVFICMWMGCMYYRYKISIALLWSHYCLTLKDDPENNQFDAFIAHSNSTNDCNFVYKWLLPFLKSHNFSPCIREINFHPGGDCFNDSTAAVEASQRTILILSPEFLKNSQCLHELEVALYNMIKKRKSHKIIPIILQYMENSEVKKFKQLERVLVFVKKLRWAEEKPERFHKKLLELMPKERTVISNGHGRFLQDNPTFTPEDTNHV